MIKHHRFKEADIRYSDKGKGRVVVLIHGFLESLEIWTSLTQKLTKRFRVISIDLPGHGGTECIGYVHSMELMAQCVKSVMDNLKLRKYAVIGHSMGGYVSLAFADLFPDNVKGLCLFHSTSLADTPEKKEGRQRAIKAVKANHSKFINEVVTNLFAEENRKLMKEEIKEVKDIAVKTSKRSIIAALEGMKERPNREVILKFAAYPVLFIIGKKDTVIPWESLKEQVYLVQNHIVLMLENAAHMGFYEAKETTEKAVYRFVGRCFRG